MPQENLNFDNDNVFQVRMASELYNDLNISDDEMMERWVSEGYSKKYMDYLAEHPEIEEKIIQDEEEALSEIKSNILYH